MDAKISKQLISLKNKNFAKEEINSIFQQFFLAYLRAEETSGEKNYLNFRIANQNICLRFAGNRLINTFTRALNHLETNENSVPDFTIYIWDSRSTNQKLPNFFEEFNEFVNSNQNAELRAIRGDIPKLSNERFRTALMGDNRLTMADLEQKICVHWISDVAEIPHFELAAPLRVAFNFMFSEYYRQLVHGGAVGHADGGVFLGGIGGSGKSTTAMNCIFSSIFYASDDYVVIDLENKPTAYSIYNTGKLKTFNDLARFPKLKELLMHENSIDIDQEKPVFFFNELLPQKLISKIPLKAIVFPKFVSGEKIHYKSIAQQRAFREIATSTIRQTPGDDQIAIAMIGRLIRQLPCYELIFGENQKELPNFIDKIISENR